MADAKQGITREEMLEAMREKRKQLEKAIRECEFSFFLFSEDEEKDTLHVIIKDGWVEVHNITTGERLIEQQSIRARLEW